MAESKYTGKNISDDNFFAQQGTSASARVNFFGKDKNIDNVVEDEITNEAASVLAKTVEEGWDSNDSLMTARAFTDGLWLNKGEEIGAWIGAAVYKGFGMYGSEDKTIAQIKEEMLTRSEAESAQFVEERPVAAISANIAGNIFSPVSVKGGQLLSQARSLRAGELARQSSVATRQATQGVLGGRAAVGATPQQAQQSAQLAQQLSGFNPTAFNIATKTPMPVLGAGLTAAESAVIGFEGDTLQEKLVSSGQSAALGAVFSGALSTTGFLYNKAVKTNVAQELGEKANFVNLMFTEHALAPVYRHVVAKAYGGKGLIEQQVRALTSRMPALETMKQRGVDVVADAKKTMARAKAVAAGDKKAQLENSKRIGEDLKNDLKAATKLKEEELDADSKLRIAALKAESNTTDQITAAAAKEADAAVNAAVSSFRTSAFVKSLPEGVPKTLVDEIQALSPQEALVELRNAWKIHGFTAAQKQTYNLNLDDTIGNIDKLLKKTPESVALAGSGGRSVVGTINDYVSSFIKNNTTDGVMTGTALTDLRSGIGTIINSLSENQTATRKVAKPIQDYFDDVLMSQLDETAKKSFMKDKELWRFKSTLEDAVLKATGRGKMQQGAFTPDEWIEANKLQGKSTAAVGAGILQKEAQEVSILAKEREKLIIGNAEKNASLLKTKAAQAIEAEERALKAKLDEIAKEHDRRKVEIARMQRGAVASADLTQARKVALAEERNRFATEFAEVKDDIARLKKGLNFFRANEPKEASIFERLFATSLLASATPAAFVAAGGSFGLGIATAGLGAARGLASESTQRLLAGQTGAQRAGSELAKRLEKAAETLAQRYGVTYTPVAAAGAAPDAQDKLVFDQKSRAVIMKQSLKSKANIYRGLLSAGKVDTLRAQDPVLYKELKNAYDTQ